MRWFVRGDVDGFFLSVAQPHLVDVIHLCYWSYFVLMIIPGAVLYFKDECPRLREYVAVILMALFTSYLGYFVVPAIGPHHFIIPRPEALDGWLIGGIMHRVLMAIEWRMADAFPSVGIDILERDHASPNLTDPGLVRTH